MRIPLHHVEGNHRKEGSMTKKEGTSLTKPHYFCGGLLMVFGPFQHQNVWDLNTGCGATNSIILTDEMVEDIARAREARRKHFSYHTRVKTPRCIVAPDEGLGALFGGTQSPTSVDDRGSDMSGLGALFE
jgi:hypothetical protein